MSHESDTTVKALAVTSKETAAALALKMLEVAAFIGGKQAAKFRPYDTRPSTTRPST